MSHSPFVSLNPAMRSGSPCLNDTRLSVAAVTELVWAGETVATVADEYDITRADVLVACWYAGTYGDAEWSTRWYAWAHEVHPALWRVTSVDYEAIPDPPSKEDS